MSRPSLNHKDKFEEILAKYEISPDNQALLAKMDLMFLVSLTSAGRNTIIRELLETGKYEYLVSDTTRPPRQNDGVMEQDGVEYYFRDEQEMLEDLRAGKYLEAAIIHNQQVSGARVEEVQHVNESGKIAVTEIEIVGAEKIHKAAPHAHFVFVLPPSFAEWMQRLERRGTMTSDEIKNRFESAEKELEAAINHDFYKFVVNDDLGEAVQEIRAIAEDGKYDEALNERAEQLAWKILGKLKQELHS